MKLLIAGVSSPMGRDFTDLLKKQEIAHQSIPQRMLNAMDKEALQQLIDRFNPDQLINFNTYRPNSQAAVYKAESDKEKCSKLGYEQTRLLAELCAKKDIPLLHLSTCYVFDGDKKLGYNEQDDTGPAGVYGKVAVKGEKAVAALSRHVILRTGWMFGPNLCDVIDGWIKTCKKEGGDLEVLRHRFSPTATEDIARVVLAVCQQVDCDASVWGTYHYCGLETKKEGEFVQQVLKYASQYDEQIYQLLDTIKISEIYAETPEVQNTTLSSKKIFDTFGIKQRSWHGYLKNTIKSVCQGSDEAEIFSTPGASVSVPENFSSKSLH